LQNGCRSLIDSTALPPPLDGAVATLELVRGRATVCAFFARTRNRFPTRVRQLRFATDGSTQILPLVVGESEAAVDLSAALGRARGVRNVDPPAIRARGNYAPALLAMATYHEGDLEHVQSALESVRAKGVKR
jgi:8-amino-7-oxononanoate synthase